MKALSVLLSVAFILLMSLGCGDQTTDEPPLLVGATPDAAVAQSPFANEGESTSNPAERAVADVETDSEAETDIGTDTSSMPAASTPIADESSSDETTEPTSEPESALPEEDETVDTDSVPDESTAQPNMGDETNCFLTFTAEAKDQDGPGEQCTAGQYITVVGIIENPCQTARTYTAQRDCLVQEFIVRNLDFGSQSEYPMTCGGARSEIIQPGQSITQSRPAGRLSNAQYELTVFFGDDADTIESTQFSVQ